MTTFERLARILSGKAAPVNWVEDAFATMSENDLTDDIKEALLQVAEKIAYVDDQGQKYYDDLYVALYPDHVVDAISAVYTQSGTVYPTTSLDSLKTDLVVTAHYKDDTTSTLSADDYTLSGTLNVGNSTVTVTYSSFTTTFTVVVSKIPELLSISAVYTQSGAVYTNDSLDSLKSDLVVTATYDDASTVTVPSEDYTLSGTLAEGTQTITVSYSDKTATFTVSCTVKGWLYHFEQSLASSGENDFGFTGSVTYDTGYSGSGYSFYNNPSCISASGFTAPDLTGDFTISFWAKTAISGNGQGFSPYTHTSGSSSPEMLGTSANVKSGWSVADNYSSNAYYGLRLGAWGTTTTITMRLHNYDNSKSVNFAVTPPSGFASTEWHHYAWTRKNGTFRFFVDGDVIFTSDFSDRLMFATQCALGGWYDSTTPSTPSANKSYYDDLFVAEYCKWDSDFDSSAITY